jgi:hypothetical protein
MMVVGALLVGVAILAYSQRASAEEWIQLFDGKSLDGWEEIGDSNCRVVDGALVLLSH